MFRSWCNGQFTHWREKPVAIAHPPDSGNSRHKCLFLCLFYMGWISISNRVRFARVPTHITRSNMCARNQTPANVPPCRIIKPKRSATLHAELRAPDLWNHWPPFPSPIFFASHIAKKFTTIFSFGRCFGFLANKNPTNRQVGTHTVYSSIVIRSRYWLTALLLL